MADDVVEQAPFGQVRREMLAAQIDIRNPKPIDDRLTIGDLPRRQVDSHATRLGKRNGHRNQIAAAGATQFENAATARIRATTRPNSNATAAVTWGCVSGNGLLSYGTSS